MRRLLKTLSLLPLLFGWAAAGWLLVNNPMAWPVLERSGETLRQAMESQIAKALDTGKLDTALAEAVATGDAVRTDILLELAETNGVEVPADLLVRARALTGADEAWWTLAGACAVCAYDIASCRSISAIAVCAVPTELTPIGDLAAIGRAGAAYAAGDEVDKLDLSLGLVGLAASGAVFVTAGSSATIKAGSGLVRLSRKLGSLSPGMRRALGEATDLPIRWSMVDDLMLRRVKIEAVTDVAKLGSLAAIAADAGRIIRATSAADGLVLLRHADSPADLARISRLAEAGGTKTTDAFALMGKARVFRLFTRATALWAAFLGFLAGVALQLASIAATRLTRGLIRTAARRGA